ncbi:asparagine synthase (glutamine-hydrolyzing) [bacterium]|nr:asparagine synthase (glutamine-hydrolyzing) [bacterium]
MCGIAGFIDLHGRMDVDLDTLRRMAQAIVHRGPDEEGFFVEPGVGLASRRLSIVGLADGQQPIFNEDGSVVVVFNGELFDYPEMRDFLKSRGHLFRTSSDTELLVHLWEEYGEGMLEKLRGQFAFALYDRRQKTIILARDRVGICPLHYSRQGDVLYFGSEIKAILASNKVPKKPDLRGIDHIFTYFAMATRRTSFEGVSSLLAGTYLSIKLNKDGGRAGTVTEKTYWDLDFPNRGDEECPTQKQAIEGFSEVFHEAVNIRLRAEVPVVSYLSGGVDSTSVASTISRIRGESVPTFTIRIADPKLDETDRALMAAKTIGSTPTIVTLHGPDISAAYPELVRASDCPVVDTSSAAMLCLAKEVHRQGFRCAMTGEGADESLAGYPWFKINRLLRSFDVGSFRPSMAIRRTFLRLTAPNVSWTKARRAFDLVGGPYAYNDLYGIMTMSRHLFYKPETFERIGDRFAYDDFSLNLERMKHWHPMNQGLYFGFKTLLAGLLLNHKGDRPAMNSSVETRYPFLDDKVIAYCAKLNPTWKLHGFFRDKHLLRLYAGQMLPAAIANRPKAMFRAPFASTFFNDPANYVKDVLSRESLEKTGLFDPDQVLKYRAEYGNFSWARGRRLTIEMGLTAVMATQLWYHTYFGGGLCDLPTWTPQPYDNSKPAIIRRPPSARMTAAG